MKSIIATLGVAVFGFAFGSAQAQQDPGLTGTTIKIGLFGPLSGNSMDYGFDAINAAKMYYEKINREGGIHGRKVTLVIEDDRCSANDLLAAAKKLTEQDKVFMLHGGSCSGSVVGAKDYVERSKIPYVMLNASGDSILYPPSKYIYGAFSITQHALGGSTVQFAFEHLKAKKIGYINHDDAYGAWNLEGAEFQAKKIGAQLNVQPINPALTDVTAPMLKLRAGGVDALIIATYARPVSLIVKKAHELGFNKPIIISVNGTADTRQLFENVGTRDAFKNVYLQEVLSDRPGGAKLQWAYDLYKQSYPELAAKPGYPQIYMYNGLASTMTVVNALKAAGRDLTRDKFLAAMAKTNLDTTLMAGPIVLSDTEHGAQKSAFYVKFDGEKYDRIPGIYRGLWTHMP